MSSGDIEILVIVGVADEALRLIATVDSRIPLIERALLARRRIPCEFAGAERATRTRRAFQHDQLASGTRSSIGQQGSDSRWLAFSAGSAHAV